MPDDSSRIVLTGFTNADRIDGLFASRMVDVAYIDRMTPDAIYVISDDPPATADYPWIADIIQHVLTEEGITGVNISLPTSRELATTT